VQRRLDDRLDLLREIEGLRPRPGRTAANWASPSKAKRPRQIRTVSGMTPTFAAMRAFAIPSPAQSSTCARCTIRAGTVRDFASFFSVSRCPSDNSSATAAWFIWPYYHNTLLIYETLH
jgi:hypothetical protein